MTYWFFSHSLCEEVIYSTQKWFIYNHSYTQVRPAHILKVDNTNLSKPVLWLSVSHEILNLENDIDFGVMYIPPHGSKFASDDPYMELQR